MDTTPKQLNYNCQKYLGILKPKWFHKLRNGNNLKLLGDPTWPSDSAPAFAPALKPLGDPTWPYDSAPAFDPRIWFQYFLRTA